MSRRHRPFQDRLERLLSDAGARWPLSKDEHAAVAELVELAKAEQLAIRKVDLRWIVVVVGVALLIGLVLLYLMPMRNMSATVAGEATGLSIVTGGDDPQLLLFGVQQIRSLKVDGFGPASFDTAQGERKTLPPNVSLSVDEDTCPVLASVADEPANAALSMNSILVSPGTRVQLIAQPPHGLRLTFSQEPVSFAIAAAGAVRVATADGAINECISSSETQKSHLPLSTMADGQLDLTVELGASSLLFSQLLRISEIRLSHREVIEHLDGRYHREMPDIVRADITLHGMPDWEYALTARERLEATISPSSMAEIRSLKLVDGLLHFTFRGALDELRVGPERRSELPRVVEYLASRDIMALVWSSFLYLLGLVIVVTRWWSKTD